MPLKSNVPPVTERKAESFGSTTFVPPEDVPQFSVSVPTPVYAIEDAVEPVGALKVPESVPERVLACDGTRPTTARPAARAKDRNMIVPTKNNYSGEIGFSSSNFQDILLPQSCLILNFKFYQCFTRYFLTMFRHEAEN